MILNIKLQSFSDIITNSSSEIFTIQNPDKSPEEIVSLLRKLSEENRPPYESCTDPKKRTKLVKDYYKNKENYNSESGEGGIIKVFSFKEKKNKNSLKILYPKVKENHLLMKIIPFLNLEISKTRKKVIVLQLTKDIGRL